MPIGTSNPDQPYYEDDYAHAAAMHENSQKEAAISIRPAQMPKQERDAAEMQFNEKAGSFDNRFNPAEYQPLTQSTMPPGSPTEPAGALKPEGGTNVPGNQYETRLSPEEETKFQTWKQKNAPNDTGEDYDLRGAFKAGVQPDEATGHWPDTYKKPNHPTFSDESIYAKDRPDLAGSWTGPNHDQYVPPTPRSVMDKLLGTGGERYQLWPEKAVRSMISGAMAPGEAWQGKLPGWAMDPETGEFHTSTQMIEKANELAGLMVAGPAPVARKLADGTLGSFAGVRSKGFERSKLGEAQVMKANAAHPDHVWDKTGWFRGADNRWRYEISDKDMKLNEDAFHKTVTMHPTDSSKDITTYSPITKTEAPKLDTVEDLMSFILKSKDKPMTLEQSINHPELFKAYPELRGIKVRELPPEEVAQGVKGMMWRKELFLAPNLTKEKVRSTIMHEVQHEIQNIEGFARGGNSDMFKYPLHDVAESFYRRIRDDELKKLSKNYTREHLLDLITQVDTHLKTGEPLGEFFKSEVGKKIYNLTKAQHLLDQDLLRRHKLYRRIKGEVESRNVEARLDFEDVTRKLFPPYRTEEMDVPRFMQHEP